MPMSTTNIDWAEIQTYFTGANPVGLNEYYANGSYVNNEQLKSNGSAFPTSGQISGGDFSGIYYGWNNNNTNCTMAYTAAAYLQPEQLIFRYSNGGADTGSWSNPHCRLLPKWNDTGASGSGVAQNRVCLVQLYYSFNLSTVGPALEILTPNGNTGNSNWTRIRWVGTSGNINKTLNRSAATYTLVGDGYGYTTASGYSVERWEWPFSNATNNNTSNWTGAVWIEK